MKIAAIVQARMESDRFLGKSMADLCGEPMLKRIVDRVMTVVPVIIVTTPASLRIIDYAESMGIPCSLDRKPRDVLDSYYHAAEKYEVENIIRLTADNPLVDPEIIKEMIDSFNRWDYLSNSQSCPIGMNIEIFTFDALQRANKEAGSKYDREHVTPYIYNHPELFRLANHTHQPDLSHLRWTVDYPEDMGFAREVYSKLGGSFNMNDILELIKGGVLA